MKLTHQKFFVAVVVMLMSVTAFAPTAFAADMFGDEWTDYGSYGGWEDYGSYGGWEDYGSYGGWEDYGSYGGWEDYGSYGDWQDYGSYGGTYYDDVSGTYYDDVTGTYYDDVSGTYYDDECGCYGYDSEDSYYYDEECNCYSSRSSGGGSFGRGGGFGGFSGGGYSVRPVTFAPPQYPQRPTPGGSNTNITNTTVTTTNIDNSINDSFNNYNSNNTYVVPATPQYPVVYTAPAPYCTIYQAQAAGYGAGVYLSWSSTNATSAYLSNVGSVNLNGSQTVYANSATTYTLTVYGQNGQSATCYTSVTATPYVSLTQIPYTGFDLGTFGNAMYWAGLVTFALGAGYLAVYYIPALALAGNRSRKAYAPVVAAKAPILVEREIAAASVSPIVEAIKKTGTTDAMAIVTSKDGSMPKIVISRN